jgi:RNA polymerase sigma-70 factor (ECF subfamily)
MVGLGVVHSGATRTRVTALTIREQVPGDLIMTPTNDDFGCAILVHTAALRRYARRLTPTADQADDLVQDCLERALGRPQLYTPGSNLRAWLFTMLRNIALTGIRKAKCRQDYASGQRSSAAQVTPPNQLHHVALTQSLQHIKTLPPRERQAVALLGILEMTYEEAAQQSGMAVGTMKSRLSRGRARLRHLAEPALLAA